MTKQDKESFQNWCKNNGFNFNYREIEKTGHFRAWMSAVESERERLHKEIEEILSTDTGAIGDQADAYLASMESMRETHRLHSIGVLLRGLFYRGYTAGKKAQE